MTLPPRLRPRFRPRLPLLRTPPRRPRRLEFFQLHRLETSDAASQLAHAGSSCCRTDLLAEEPVHGDKFRGEGSSAACAVAAWGGGRESERARWVRRRSTSMPVLHFTPSAVG